MTLTTAKSGNPRAASRGDAARRARVSLVEAIELKLNIEPCDAELTDPFAVAETLACEEAVKVELGRLLDCDPHVSPARLATLTLGEAEDVKGKV